MENRKSIYHSEEPNIGLIKQKLSGFAPIKLSVKKARNYDGSKEQPTSLCLVILNSKLQKHFDCL